MALAGTIEDMINRGVASRQILEIAASRAMTKHFPDGMGVNYHGKVILEFGIEASRPTHVKVNNRTYKIHELDI